MVSACITLTSSYDSFTFLCLPDYLANNLYWVDYIKNSIEVFSLNTKKRAVLQHYLGTDKPTALALIPSRGEMFVALQSLDHFHIDRQSMKGGSEHHHVIETGLSQRGPIHFAVDEVNQTLYWSDGGGKKIEFSDFNGVNRRLFASTRKAPGPLALINEELYWTSLESRTLQWRQKNAQSGIKMVDIEKPPGVGKTPSVINIAAGTPLHFVAHPCMIKNGGCSDICISDGPSSRVCLCETGHLFKDSSNTTCVKRLDCGFRCSSSGECLESSQRCNGKIECLDKSDEDDCEKETIKCDATQFKCRDGKQCIPAVQHCDKHFNCNDKSDEDDCKDKQIHCRSNEMLCPSEFCIEVTQRCDGHDDCGDGYDERPDLCKSVGCPSDYFTCMSGQCVLAKFECNGIIDCKDASDEHTDCSECLQIFS